MATVQELRKLAKARKVPKYSRMTKPQLLGALGMSSEKKAHQSDTTRRNAIAAHAKHIGGDSATQKAIIKGRITRAIKRELTSQEKGLGRKLTQEEKRSVAVKAIATEAKAIKAGKPENKPKRGKLTDQKFADPKLNQIFAEAQDISEDFDRKSRKLKKSIQESRQSADSLERDTGNFVAELSEHTVGAKDGIKPFKRKKAADIPSDVADRGLSYVLDRDRHGRIREAMDNGDDKMLRYKAREAGLNASGQDSRHVKDLDHYADAVVKAYKEKHGKKSEDSKPAEQKIRLEDVKTPEDRAKYAKQEAEHQRSQGNDSAAKAWEDKAKEARKAAIKRDMTAQNTTQAGLFGVAEHSSDMPLFGGSNSEPKKSESAPRGLAEVSPHDLHFDPKRFQYKMAHGAETGSSGSLTDVRKWDENLGGVMQVWRDPKDGKDYVVNGHNRATLARKLGAEKVAVRYLNVDTPHEARAIGALTNVSEGNGTALDAAKFFRDSGITREDLEAKGIPMKQKIATDGLALSKLAPHLFDKVVQGDIPTERATLIGDRIHDHDAQSKLVELIDKAQSKGRKITNDVVRELADTVQSAPSHTETQFNLFGAEESTQNLALEKAELTAHVRSRLSREKKLFGLVSKSKAAKDLERGGNSIDTEKSKDISEQAGQVLGVFDKLKNQSGPVSSAINQATERIANGEDPKKVKDELHEQLLTEIPQALGIRKEQRSEGTEKASGETKTLRIKRSQ